MRKNGTKYTAIDRLPNNALTVSKYANQQGIAVAQVYTKYERHITGYLNGNKGSDPGYSIVCWQGMNWVVPG